MSLTLSLFTGVVSGLHQLFKLCRHGNGNLQRKEDTKQLRDSVLLLLLTQRDPTAWRQLCYLVGMLSVELLYVFQSVVELSKLIWSRDGSELVSPHPAKQNGFKVLNVR